uniref:Galactokinase N-terminal domain-containing protein n=1 Tax=Phaeomonas parva TaxID=124430 RepID=A0A6U4EBP3_9STRA|mmetsp:Transcript_20211/g.61325  ORF Transcript_20211/g.61325 Transcript_20211/m.61325 type:complete len:382 (+) Transcript_20211:83-1228(+)
MASVEPEAKEVLLTRAQALFRRTYPELSADIAVFAPGRVNLIGEHTDYTNGFVCPMALTAATVIVGVGDVVDEDAVGSAAAAEGDLLCRIVSTAPGTELAVFDCGRPLTPGGGWSTYVKGVVAEYLGDLPPRKTLVFTFACASSVPLGSGLSSSASLEVAVATFLERVTRRPQPLVTRALRCQSAEHIFANTPCGIMDQFISAMGREGRALLIDCASNKVVQEVQFLSDDYTIVVCDSKVKHNLGESEYPARVRECRSAEAALRSRFGEGNFPNGLRDATPSMVEDLHAAGLIDDVVHRRAFHVVTENDRCQVSRSRNQPFHIVTAKASRVHPNPNPDPKTAKPKGLRSGDGARGLRRRGFAHERVARVAPRQLRGELPRA